MCNFAPAITPYLPIGAVKVWARHIEMGVLQRFVFGFLNLGNSSYLTKT